MQVSSSEFQKQIGHFQDQALTEPVFVTRNGRQRTVLMSVAEYERLQKLAQRTLPVESLSEADLMAIEEATVPSQYEILTT